MTRLRFDKVATEFYLMGYELQKKSGGYRPKGEIERFTNLTEAKEWIDQAIRLDIETNKEDETEENENKDIAIELDPNDKEATIFAIYFQTYTTPGGHEKIDIYSDGHVVYSDYIFHEKAPTSSTVETTKSLFSFQPCSVIDGVSATEEKYFELITEKTGWVVEQDINAGIDGDKYWIGDSERFFENVDVDVVIGVLQNWVYKDTELDDD
jgi:hypothetical protein